MTLSLFLTVTAILAVLTIGEIVANMFTKD